MEGGVLVIQNRVDLLMELIYLDDDIAEKAFDALVPKFQSELYVLYNILDGVDLLEDSVITIPNISDIIENSDDVKLTVSIDCTKSKSIAIFRFVNDNPEILTPYRDSKSFDIKIEKTSTGVTINWN